MLTSQFLSDMSFESFKQIYSTDRKCEEVLFSLRFPDGFRCRRCGCARHYKIATRRLTLLECAGCSDQTTLIVGTVMEGSRTPLPKWFQAIYLLARPGGITSAKLSDVIGVTRKTAWTMTRKLRQIIGEADAEQPLAGIVRVDRVAYGYQFYSDAQQPLLIGGSLDEKGQPERIKIKQPDPGHVKVDSRWIREEGVQAFVSQHLTGSAVPVFAVRGKRHPQLNRIHWEVRTWLNRTFCGIGPKHLQAYLDEFCFRWNELASGTSAISRLLGLSATRRKKTYKELIRSVPVLPCPWLAFGSKSKWKGWHMTQWAS